MSVQGSSEAKGTAAIPPAPIPGWGDLLKPILGLAVRHVAGAIAGGLVTHGWASSSTGEQVSGAIVGAGVLFWSWWNKRGRAMLEVNNRRGEMAVEMLDKPRMTPLAMFTELMRLGYVVPARSAPSRLKEPTAYVSVPTTLAFSTPPVAGQVSGKRKNAKLESRSKGNSKRKRRARRR